MCFYNMILMKTAQSFFTAESDHIISIQYLKQSVSEI